MIFQVKLKVARPISAVKSSLMKKFNRKKERSQNSLVKDSRVFLTLIKKIDETGWAVPMLSLSTILLAKSKTSLTTASLREMISVWSANLLMRKKVSTKTWVMRVNNKTLRTPLLETRVSNKCRKMNITMAAISASHKSPNN